MREVGVSMDNCVAHGPGYLVARALSLYQTATFGGMAFGPEAGLELVDELTRQRRKLSGLTTRPATLEDVFVKLAGRHLTDEEQKDQR